MRKERVAGSKLVTLAELVEEILNYRNGWKVPFLWRRAVVKRYGWTA